MHTTAAGRVSVAARHVTLFQAQFPALPLAQVGYDLVGLGNPFQTHTVHMRLKRNVISLGDNYFHLQ